MLAKEKCMYKINIYTNKHIKLNLYVTRDSTQLHKEVLKILNFSQL